MSSRVLKKLQGPSDLEVLKDLSLDEDEEDDDDDIGRNAKGQHFNPFDLLNQQSLSESEVKEDDNETENATTEANPSASSVTKKKKKKRKKKATAKNAGNCISSEDNELRTEKLRKVKPQNALSSDQPTAKAAVNGSANVASPTGPTLREQLRQYNAMLQVELRHLNPQNEMRRTFGKRVVKSESKRGRQKLNYKSTHLVNPKDTWPPHNKNFLSMRMVEPPRYLRSELGPIDNGFHWFEFEHTALYQKVQKMFAASLERSDTDILIGLVRTHPYHVDSLLQLSDMCKMTDDFSLAAELVQRAVLSMELALHPSFSLTSGNSYLDYTRQENRDFFVTLFRHAQYLESRACTRTALEVAKLLLNLNPVADPVAMVLVIDYYALRCHQYEWLLQFYKRFDAYRNLQQLPNMAYSYALAMYHLRGECDDSNNALMYALLMFPGVLLPLMDELSHPLDKRIQTCDYFKSDISGNQSPALHQLVCLYVCRAKVVWREPSVLTWLEGMAKVAVERYDSGDPIIADYKAKRDARYVQPPRPILRHVVLSDFKEKVPLSAFLVPTDTPLLSYDPLPPPNSVSCYDKKARNGTASIPLTNSVSLFFQSLLPNFMAGGNAGAQHVPADADEDVPPMAEAAAADAGQVAPVVRAVEVAAQPPNREADLNDEMDPVGRTLQMLNINLEQIQNAAEAQENGAGEMHGEVAAAANTYRELTQSFSNIVDAMRDFLHNFHMQGMNAEEGRTDGDNNAHVHHNDDDDDDDDEDDDDTDAPLAAD